MYPPPVERLLATFRNRPFRWALLLIVGLPVFAAYWLDTIQIPLQRGFNWPLDGNVYLDAAARLAHGGDPYAGFNAAGSVLQGGYVYPPLLAWALQPLTQLSQVQADTILLVADQALFLASFAAAMAAFQVTVPWRIYVYLLVFLGFEPNWEDLFLLQANPLIALGAAVFVLAWSRGRSWGWVVVGAGIAVKLLLAPLLLLPLLRRRWRELGITALVIAVLTVVASPGHLLEYLTRILPVAGRGTGSLANLAPGAVANWLLSPGTLYNTATAPGPLPALITAAVAIAVLAVTAWRLRSPAGTTLGRAAEAGLLVSTLPLLSSLAWANYLAVVMVALVGCFEVSLRRRTPWPAVLAAAFWLLLGPLHLVEVNLLSQHRGDAVVRLSMATNSVTGGWDLVFRLWALTGPLALGCLWAGALLAHRLASLERVPAPLPSLPPADRSHPGAPAAAPPAAPSSRARPS